jgi:hypothetical protein
LRGAHTIQARLRPAGPHHRIGQGKAAIQADPPQIEGSGKFKTPRADRIDILAHAVIVVAVWAVVTLAMAWATRL